MVSGQRVLLIAAEPREFGGLLPYCRRVRKTGWPVSWSVSGTCRGRRFWMVANGAGAALAARAVEVARPACDPDVIVSTGFCGALDPRLKIGAVCVPVSIQAPARRYPVCQPASHKPFAAGVLVSIDRVAQTADEKRQLRAGGAYAVDMEAIGVAERAAQYDLPLFCVRSVTDTASHTFVTDFNQALRSDGHFDTISILTSAFRNPGQALPELIRLRRYSRIAARRLGAFIAGCRF
jgi:adenosylhomocysteine nucleosidase